MTAVFSQKQIGLKNTTVSTTVAESPIAKLMYYIYCITNVLPINQNGELTRFVNYSQYNTLSLEEKKQLLALCVLLRPDILMGKCIFLAPQLCKNFSNSFYQINQVNKVLAVSNQILIGGQQTKVTSIMTFTLNWLERNYLGPLKSLSAQIQAIQRQKTYKPPSYSRQSNNSCCQIM